MNAETKVTVHPLTDAGVREQGAHAAPARRAARKAAKEKKNAPGRAQNGKGAKSRAAANPGAKQAKPARQPATTRPESKGAKILELIARAKGATLAELMKSTGWQSHSVRGFISNARKTRGAKIESSKNEAGDRVYKTMAK